MQPILERCTHHGVILDASREGFDNCSAGMGSIFACEDEPNKLFLFYAGTNDVYWSQSAIGLAVSNDGVRFQKVDRPVLQGCREVFCRRQAFNPVVARLGSRFYMILSGTSDSNATRRIGIAYADEPKGPWHVIGELIKPTHFWEGNAIDNGCSLAKLDDESFLVYYSSLTTPKFYDVFTFLRRYPIRRIGILKVRVHGTSPSSIEAMRFNGNPLSNLNGSKGSWNESVFCPGYLRINDARLLFPTASTYSDPFPYRQCVGLATAASPYFHKEEMHIEKLVDGPLEKAKIIPGVRSEIALDTASPHLNSDESKLYLYYSVADRADEKWRIALTTYDLYSIERQNNKSGVANPRKHFS